MTLTNEDLERVIGRRLDDFAAHFNRRMDDMDAKLASHRAESAASLAKVEIRLQDIDTLKFKAAFGFAVGAALFIWTQIAKKLGW